MGLKEKNQDYRSGFVSIVGRPNVGKSTLTNALVGSKVAITSNRPETTRHNVRGVCTTENAQLVLVDTPGIHRPRTLLGKRLNDLVREALVDVDAVVFCLPADQKIGPGDRFIAQELKSLKCPVLVAVTKTDLVHKNQMAKVLSAIDQLGDWAEIVPISAKKSRLGSLVELLASHLPVSPPLYPTDQVADESIEKMVAELVREAALEGVRDELPHSIAVVVEEILYHDEIVGPKFAYGIRQGEDGNLAHTEGALMADLAPVADDCEGEKSSRKRLDVHVNVYVERDSQKGILIGKGGAHIRRVRIRAKREIKRLLGHPINLELHVRVAKNWQSDSKLLGRLGF